MKQLTLPSMLALLVFGFAAHADDLKIKPGLWEVQNNMNVNGQQMPDMNEMMADVPPEMRAQMQGMMEKHGAGMTDKGMTICITPEQIANGNIGQNDPKSDCKMTDMKHSGNKTTMKMHCEGAHKAEGSTEITRISETQWQSVTQMQSKDGTMKSKSTGKWLKSDCGNVKPVGQKAK